MNQTLAYWNSVARSAWIETTAAHNWKVAPIIRRALAFVILSATLIASGGIEPFQDKLAAAGLVLAAFVVVFLLEFIWRMFAIPARMAAEQTKSIESLEARNSRISITRDVIARFTLEFREGAALQEQLSESIAQKSVASFRKRVDEWDKRVHALVKEYAAGEAFAYESAASLPSGRGVGLLLTPEREIRKRLADFVATKREKLRRIVMRLEERVRPG